MPTAHEAPGAARGGGIQGERRVNTFSAPGSDYKSLELIIEEFFFGQTRIGTAASTQRAQTAEGAGALVFAGTGASAEDAQTTGAEGKNDSAVAPAPVVRRTGGIVGRSVWPFRAFAPTPPEVIGEAESTQAPQTARGRGHVGVVVRGSAASVQGVESSTGHGALIFTAYARNLQDAHTGLARGDVQTPEDVMWEIVAMIETTREAA